MTVMKVVIIDGSARKISETRKLVELTAVEFSKAGASVEVFDQSETSIPLFDDDTAKLDLPGLRRLFKIVSEANIVVLSSPEYHNGMSSPLKNALDWLHSHESGFTGKLVGLMGGGASMGNSGALVQMMMSVRSMHGWLMPESFVSVANIWDAFSDDGSLLNEGLAARLREFVSKLLFFAPRFIVGGSDVKNEQASM